MIQYFPHGASRQEVALTSIEKTDIFIVIGSEEYFMDAMCIAQSEYAKTLKKPFFIALQKGVEIPDFFLENITGEPFILEWETNLPSPQQMAILIKKFMVDNKMLNEGDEIVCS